jgi:hypothetical protein
VTLADVSVYSIHVVRDDLSDTAAASLRTPGSIMWGG